ncbi:hypothetical protein DYB32_009246, partial [Aphanomyces invadans]
MVVEGCESDCRASGSVLRSMCYRLDLVEKKTVEGDHVNQYRNQTRQVFFEMRSSYEVLGTHFVVARVPCHGRLVAVTKRNQVAAAKEKYFKACKAADSAIRVRNSTRDKTESEIAAKKNTPTLQHPPLALLEAKRDEVVAGLNLKIQAALDESSAAKEVYIQADAACQAERLRHESVVADMLRKLDVTEVQREEHLQNQVFFRLAAMYQDMVTCLTAMHNALFDESDAAFTVTQPIAGSRWVLDTNQAARDGVAHFSDDFHSPDDILTYATDQVTNDLDTLAKLSEVRAKHGRVHDDVGACVGELVLIEQMPRAIAACAARLQQVASSASWALSDLDGELLAHAWDKIRSSVQVFARIHGDFSNAIGGSIPSVWKDLKAAHGHAKKQLATMVQRIVLKRQGVYTNERDATVRFHQAKRELDAKHAQLSAVEREAVDEATSPDKGIMTLVSLGWKDPANVRLVKLKRVSAKQLAFAKHATVDFDVQYHAAVAAVHGDFINAQAHVISALAKISSSWRTACRVADTSLDHILHDVFAAIEAIDPIADLTAFVTMQKTNAMPAPETGKMARLELYTSDLIENETQPPPLALAPVEPHAGDATKVRSTSWRQSLMHDVLWMPSMKPVQAFHARNCGQYTMGGSISMLRAEIKAHVKIAHDYPNLLEPHLAVCEEGEGIAAKDRDNPDVLDRLGQVEFDVSTEVELVAENEDAISILLTSVETYSSMIPAPELDTKKHVYGGDESVKRLENASVAIAVEVMTDFAESDVVRRPSRAPRVAHDRRSNWPPSKDSRGWLGSTQVVFLARAIVDDKKHPVDMAKCKADVLAFDVIPAVGAALSTFPETHYDVYAHACRFFT